MICEVEEGTYAAAMLSTWCKRVEDAHEASGGELNPTLLPENRYFTISSTLLFYLAVYLLQDMSHQHAWSSLSRLTLVLLVSSLPCLLQVQSGMAARDQQTFNSTEKRPFSTVTAQQPAQQPESSAAQAQQPASANESANVKSNGTLAAPAQLKSHPAASNGTGASDSATATVEGWVSENLPAFVTDPDSGPDVPMASRASLSAAAVPQQQVAQQQQQQQQLQQPATGLGTNGVNVEARQAWASVRQEGAAGAWQGSGQGPSGGSGGSWTHVDDQMEDARRFLSPWRFV